MRGDEDWADGLSGRAGAEGDRLAQAEGALLRAAQRRWPAAAPASLGEAGAAGEAALLERARREGLLAPRRAWCAGCGERWRRWRQALRAPWPLAAAGGLVLAMLAVFVAVPLLQQPAEDAPGAVLRAGPDGVVLLRDADPRARRDRIARALAAAGAVVRRYERLGRQGLDAEWPQPASAAVLAALREAGLAVPAEGLLRVEVEAAAMNRWPLLLVAALIAGPGEAGAADARGAALAAACSGIQPQPLTAAQADALLRLEPARTLAAACAAGAGAEPDWLLRAAEATLELSRVAETEALLAALQPELAPATAAMGGWQLLSGQLAQQRADPAAAARHYALAREALQAGGAGGSVREARAVIGQGVVWRTRGELVRAEQAADEAQQMLAALGQAVSLDGTEVLNLRTVIAHSRNDLEATVRYAREEIAMTVAIGRGDDPELLHAYASLGGTLSQLGRFDEALAALSEGLALMERHPDAAPYAQLGLLQNLAQTQLSLGHADLALPLVERALVIARGSYGENSPRLVRPLQLRAQVHWVAARYGAAAQAARQALEQAQRHRDKLPAATLFDVRDIWAGAELALGDAAAARRVLDQGLDELARGGGDAYWRGRLLRSLARVERYEGRWTDAAEHLAQATGLIAGVIGAANPYVIDMQAFRCLLLPRLGAAAVADACAAVRSALPSLGGTRASDRWRAHAALAGEAQAAGERAAAGALLLEALAAAQGAGTADPLWLAFDGLARHQRDEGHAALAVYFGKQAITAVEALRSEVQSQAAASERGFLTDKLEVYRRVADWLAEDGRIDEALDVLRLLKEEEFFDFVQRDGTLAGGRAGVELNPAERRIDERWRRLREPAAPTTTAAWPQRAQALLDEMAAAAAAPASTAEPVDLPRRAVAPGELRVQAIAAEDRLTLVLDAASGRSVQRLAWGRAAIGREVGAALAALGRGGDALPQLQALYRRIGEPIDQAARAAGAQRLVLQLDAALRYLPLGALHDGRRFLGERYAIESRAAGSGAAAAAGLDGARLHAVGVSRATAGRRALPGVADEICAIVDGPVHGLAPGACAAGTARGVVPGEGWLNEAFTAARLRQTLALPPALLHVGTHFELRPGNMERSSLLLGDGSRLSLGELAALRFDGQALVTLSACETGLGGGQGDDGREVDGMNGVMLRRGAGAVLASLWRVDDAGTSQLMTAFYRRLAGSSPAEALRAAQQALRSSAGGTWAAPFNWAGFYVTTREP